MFACRLCANSASRMRLASEGNSDEKFPCPGNDLRDSASHRTISSVRPTLAAPFPPFTLLFLFMLRKRTKLGHGGVLRMSSGKIVQHCKRVPGKTRQRSSLRASASFSCFCCSARSSRAVASSLLISASPRKIRLKLAQKSDGLIERAPPERLRACVSAFAFVFVPLVPFVRIPAACEYHRPLETPVVRRLATPLTRRTSWRPAGSEPLLCPEFFRCFGPVFGTAR